MATHNFCIIAHIDHGKSTLADRLLELTGTVERRKMRDQLLDSMELEREKGITIKLQPVKMKWKDRILNLIDTPGHVDFQYEVSRSLQAVEGAILLVDATQGVQAQTIANLNLALEQNLEVIPVVNKIDLPAADVPRAEAELKHLLGEDIAVLKISAKTGEGVAKLLDEIVRVIPPAYAEALPAGQAGSAGLRALIFDSVYDEYKGVVAYVRLVEGSVAAGDQIAFLGTDMSDRAVEVGTFAPEFTAAGRLSAGDIGYIATGLKDIRGARVGDTVVLVAKRDKIKPLTGFQMPQPKVFAGIYPEGGDDFPALREALAKLQLNDASLTVQPEQNEALGQGFRCGFLGMLHLEIVQERLQREHDLQLVITTPSVLYQIRLRDGRQLEVATPASWPDPSSVEETREQYVRAQILTPTKYLGGVFELLRQREGELEKQEYLDADRVILTYILPLRELVVDLYDQLKSATAGYGSLSYEMVEWRASEVVKLNFLLNEEPVEALSVIVPRAKAEALGRRMVEKLKEVIPKQLFSIPVQAALGGKVIARETITAMRKDVTGHLYGGDVTRKKKLLEKQKKGKKRMGSRGSVDIPPSAYIAVLKR